MRYASSAISRLPRLSSYLLLFFYACCLSGGIVCAQNSPIQPNWAKPKWYSHEGAQEEKPGVQKGIKFTFTFNKDERASSAAIVDASGTLVRTLWMNRAYHAGTWSDWWDGKDDYGNILPNGTYKLKIVSNNVQYIWDGIIGNTEADWGGPLNWDNTASFPRSIAFAKGEGCAAAGYNEGAFATYCFPEKTPNRDVRPLTRLYQSNMPAFDIVTDGLHYYELYQGYGDSKKNRSSASTSGVIAFDLNGNKFNFSKGSITTDFVNNYTNPPTSLGPVRVVDRSFLMKSAITGIAVQKKGNLLATAHGEYRPISSGPEAKSADKIYLWDKTTGEELGSIEVPNPQKIAFDSKGNLWVISGYGTNDRLLEIREVKANPVISSPIHGLSNPVSIAISPVTGNLFVADGGITQQVLEYDTSSYAQVSSVGVKGGYGIGKSCNPTVTNTKFWFDPGPNIAAAHLVGQNGPWLTGISVDEKNDLWVMDQTTQRILHFTYRQNRWRYVNRIMSLYWAYQVAVSEGDPSRIFGGFLGFEEFHRNFAIPLKPGDPEVGNGDASWKLVRNWLPCVVTNNKMWNADQAIVDSFTFPHGVVFYLAMHTKMFTTALYKFGKDGSFQYRLGTPFGAGATLEPGTGDYYTQSSKEENGGFQYTIFKAPFVGYDKDGFPLWGSRKKVASYFADVKHGDPRSSALPPALWPSRGGIIPIYDTSVNTVATTGSAVFHLGGLPVGQNALRWKTMPQKQIAYADGNGSYPSAISSSSGGNAFQGGTAAQAKGNMIFAFFNGNWNRFACQFYHFTDDGMFLGQFGFLPNSSIPKTGVPGVDKGYPAKNTLAVLAPGFCGDASRPMFVDVGKDIYAFIGDEGYRHGIHEFKITNLQSIHESVQTINLSH